MLDKDLVRKKLADISRYRGELEPILRLSYKEFSGSYRDMRTAERDFQLIVDAAVDINVHILLSRNLPPPEKNYDSFIALGKEGALSARDARVLAPSTGLRNRLVHEYEEIDPELLYRSIKKFSAAYRKYGVAILRFLGTG